jgi:hypothetical protein
MPVLDTGIHSEGTAAGGEAGGMDRPITSGDDGRG